MESLHLEKTRSTPEVRFDPASGVLHIAGESYPENSFAFFQPLLAWVRDLLAAGEQALVLNVELSYLNTGSTKSILDLLDLLEEAFCEGRKIVINWRCDLENDRALEAAEEFQEEVSIPFNIIPASEAS